MDLEQLFLGSHQGRELILPRTSSLEEAFEIKDRTRALYSTGILGVDMLLGGGWQCGRISEVIGGERSGKSTIAYCTIAAAQREDKQTIWITAKRGSFVPHYARGCGIDLEKLIVVETETADEVIGIVCDTARLMRYGGIIILDDLSRSVYREEGFSPIAPYLTRDSSRAIAAIISVNNTTALVLTDPLLARRPTHAFWIAQQLLTIGINYDRMDVYATRSADGFIGHGVSVPLIPEVGVNHHLHLLQLATATGVVSERNAHYVFETQRLGHGKEAASQAIASDVHIRDEIRLRVLSSAWERIFIQANEETPGTVE